jgi:hypothetical protein
MGRNWTGTYRGESSQIKCTDGFGRHEEERAAASSTMEDEENGLRWGEKHMVRLLRYQDTHQG